MVLDLLRGRNYLSVRNTGNTIRSSSFNEVRKVISEWKLNELFQVNKSEMTITCKNGRQALFKGLDDTEKVKSITPEVGVITDIHVEEATETKEDDIKQLEKRLRGRSEFVKRLSLSFNPILKSHWIFKKYFSGWTDQDTFLRTSNQFILKTSRAASRSLATPV